MVLGALGRQVGPGFGGKAGQAGSCRLILAQGRPPRAALDAKLALERRFREPLDVKLALERRFRRPLEVKLALERQFCESFVAFLRFWAVSQSLEPSEVLRLPAKTELWPML